MNKQIFTKIAFAISLTLMLVTFVSAQQPKTVTDFYLSLPDGSYDLQPKGEGDSYLFRNDKVKTTAAITKFRKSLIKIEDIKNGYLKLESTEWEGGWMEIALFKKTDGSYIVAVSQVECGPACLGDVQFLTFNNQKWTDMSKQFYPSLSKEAEKAVGCHFELPRVGRTLKMWCGDTEDDNDKGEEFKFEWNGAGFEQK